MLEEEAAALAQVQAVYFLDVSVAVLRAHVVPARLLQGDPKRARVAHIDDLRSVQQIRTPLVRLTMADAHAVHRLGPGVYDVKRPEHRRRCRGENSQPQKGS